MLLRWHKVRTPRVNEVVLVLDAMRLDSLTREHRHVLLEHLWWHAGVTKHLLLGKRHLNLGLRH